MTKKSPPATVQSTIRRNLAWALTLPGSFMLNSKDGPYRTSFMQSPEIKGMMNIPPYDIPGTDRELRRIIGPWLRLRLFFRKLTVMVSREGELGDRGGIYWSYNLAGRA